MMRLLPKNREIGWTPYVWLIYSVPLLLEVYARDVSTAQGWLTVLGLAVFFVLYFRGYWVGGKREKLLIIVSLTLLGTALAPFYQTGGVMFIYAASFAPYAGLQRRAITIIGVVVLWSCVVYLTIGNPAFRWFWVPVVSLMVGAAGIHFAEVSRQNARLALAHDEVTRLAKIAERERIARDLHDLLGHTLSVIVLKSELASKLWDRDPERARREVQEVEHVSRDALTQVRSAILGYRCEGLRAEISNARNVLETAGIALECEIEPVELSARHEAVLAFAVREASTNIIRHSGAQHCLIRLREQNGACHLEIRDDGRGGDQPFGTGLTGMRERVEAIGGQLERTGNSGTVLAIALPHPKAVVEVSA